MILKPGVKFDGVQPETLKAMAEADVIFKPYGEVVVTSLLDGTHSPNSLHYSGYAFDLRTRHMAHDQIAAASKDLHERLGPDYDVVVEGDHLHVEYDPKWRK